MESFWIYCRVITPWWPFHSRSNLMSVQASSLVVGPLSDSIPVVSCSVVDFTLVTRGLLPSVEVTLWYANETVLSHLCPVEWRLGS